MTRYAILIITAVSLFSFSCAQKSVPEIARQNLLPPVQVRLDSGRYFLPECANYDFRNKKVLLELPTAQEAELSGYRAAAGCPKPIIAERLEREKQIFGEMKSTNETETRRAQMILQDKINETEERQQEIESKLDEKVDKNNF